MKLIDFVIVFLVVDFCVWVFFSKFFSKKSKCKFCSKRNKCKNNKNVQKNATII